jgi:antitoxin (DNA-binding transcriptional repressor) of toxin-antitoxin stability system
MSEKILPKSELTKVSATEFKRNQGSMLDKVVKGLRLTIFRRGKPMATVEASQGTLPLEESISTEKLGKELSDLVQKMEPKDLGIIKIVADSLAGETNETPNAGENPEEWAKKLNPENFEMIVRIARSFVRESLKSAG